MSKMEQILLGANAMASLVVGLFFLRFWRDTRDRFFWRNGAELFRLA